MSGFCIFKEKPIGAHKQVLPINNSAGGRRSWRQKHEEIGRDNCMYRRTVASLNRVVRPLLLEFLKRTGQEGRAGGRSRTATATGTKFCPCSAKG